MVARAAGLRGAFFYTTVILTGLIDFGERSASSQRLFDAVAAGRIGRPRTAWHCCLEFYSVATRLPQEFRLKPADAVALLEAEVLGRFDVQDLPRGQRRGLLTQASREGVPGGRLYDLHIAAIARSSGARVVVTDNLRDFVRLEGVGIRALDSAEAASLVGGRGRRS